MANPTTALRLKQETKKRLKRLGKQKDRSTSYLMNEAIEQFLDREETLEAEQKLVKSRWENFELTGETLSHSDVKEWAKILKTKTVSETL